MPTFTRRDLSKAGLAAAAIMTLPRTGAAREIRALDPLAFVDPELREVARTILERQQAEPAPARSRLPAERAAVKTYLQQPLADVTQRPRSIPGRRGQPDVGIVVINADTTRMRPAIVHMHGGGFVTGTASVSVRSLQELCKAIDCVAVTVDYRLAPETRYDGSLEDNYTALRWLYDQAEALGVDRKRIAVMGESAGGGHAALLAQVAHSRGEVPVAFQCLVYPMLDDRTVATPKHLGTLAWRPVNNRFGWSCFLGQEPGTERVPEAAVPARARDLSGLPPTFIGVGSIDLFVGEDMTYARRLIDAGVPTELLVVPGAFHAFDVLAPNTGIARRFAEAQRGALRRAFAETRA